MNALAETRKYQEQIAASKLQLADAAIGNAMTSQAAKGLEEEMRTSLESKDVTISKPLPQGRGELILIVGSA